MQKTHDDSGASDRAILAELLLKEHAKNLKRDLNSQAGASHTPRWEYTPN